MPTTDEHGRVEPPLADDEASSMLGFLDYQRATLAWKCGGLDAPDLAATVAVSSVTLGGLLKHMAYVEDAWVSQWLDGQEKSPPGDAVDWQADPDWEWHSAVEDSPEALFALWERAVDRSRALTASALAAGGLDTLTIGWMTPEEKLAEVLQ